MDYKEIAVALLVSKPYPHPEEGKQYKLTIYDDKVSVDDGLTVYLDIVTPFVDDRGDQLWRGTISQDDIREALLS